MTLRAARFTTSARSARSACRARTDAHTRCSLHELRSLRSLRPSRTRAPATPVAVVAAIARFTSSARSARSARRARAPRTHANARQRAHTTSDPAKILEQPPKVNFWNGRRRRRPKTPPSFATSPLVLYRGSLGPGELPFLCTFPKPRVGGKGSELPFPGRIAPNCPELPTNCQANCLFSGIVSRGGRPCTSGVSSQQGPCQGARVRCAAVFSQRHA